MKKQNLRWKFIAPYLARHKVLLIVGLSFVVMQKAVDQIAPWMVKSIIDSLSAGHGTSRITLPLVGIGMATLVSACFMFFQRYWVSSTSRKIEFEMRGGI